MEAVGHLSPGGREKLFKLASSQPQAQAIRMLQTQLLPALEGSGIRETQPFASRTGESLRS